MKKCGSRCHSCPTVSHHQHHHPTHGSMCPPRIPPLSQTRNVRFSKTNSPQQVAISPTTYHQPPPPNPSQSTNIGFNSYQQNTHNSHCNTCMHQQQVRFLSVNLVLFYNIALSTTTPTTWVLRGSASSYYRTTTAATCSTYLSTTDGTLGSPRLSCKSTSITVPYYKVPYA